MKTKVTDKQRIMINEIKNITSISYRDLFLSQTSTKRQLIPGFIITYGEKDTILFMTTQDPYFEEFVRKIREVYLEEKDHVIREGIRGKEYIDIDEVTKQMLLNGTLDKTSSMYQIYSEEPSYEESLMMEEDRLKALFPIMEYHLKELLKRLNKTLTNIELSEGINGVYYIKGIIDNAPIIIPLHMEEKEDSFNVEFGALLENAIPVEMETAFSRKGVSVYSYIDEYNYYDYTTYEVDNNKIRKTREITHQDRIIHYETQEVPKAEQQVPNHIYSLDSDPSKITWFQLPWNAYIGLEEEKWYMTESGERTEEEEKERIVENKLIYLSLTNKTFYLKELVSKRYHKKIDDRISGGNILLDFMKKRRVGLLGENVIIETHFESGGVTGKYKDSLEGRYFYQIGEELKRDCLRLVGKEQGLEEQSDLEDVKRYIKKEEA